MEGRIFVANLAILDPITKMICCFGMEIGRYGWAAPTVKIEDPIVKI